MSALEPLTPFHRDRSGAVAIVAALAMPVLIGSAALVGEFGAALLTRADHQRVADLAAYAGAVAYASTGDTAAVNGAVAAVARLNGLPAGAAQATVVASPRTSGANAVSVTVGTDQALQGARVVSSLTSVRVSASAVAEAIFQAPSCILALDSAGTGVTLSGGTNISAPACAVASNAGVSVPCGTSLTTKAVSYFSGSVSQPCAGIRAPSGTASVRIGRAQSGDPFAASSAVTTATARLTAVAAVSAPTIGSVPNGRDVTFAYDVEATQGQLAGTGCSGTFANKTWTVTCPNGGVYAFGGISLGGGITVRFNLAGTANTRYTFSRPVNNSGESLAFGAGDYVLAQGLITGGGSTTVFGAGSFAIGAGTTACDGQIYSICHKGTTLAFGGPSVFQISKGILVGGGTELALGSGAVNSYRLGPGGGGAALSMGGGARVRFADALGAGSVFEVAGDINVANGGGSCLALPAAAQHDINGALATAGGTRLGAGVYTVARYVALGGNGGGDVTCWGATLGLQGSEVTLVVGGASTPTGGTCADRAYCASAGYSTVTLTAPVAGATASMAVIGPTQAGGTAGALFTAGATNNSVSGAFYFPRGPVDLNGGAGLGSGPGQCLQLVGSRVTLGGGAAMATSCGASTAVTASAALVR